MAEITVKSGSYADLAHKVQTARADDPNIRNMRAEKHAAYRREVVEPKLAARAKAKEIPRAMWLASQSEDVQARVAKTGHP